MLAAPTSSSTTSNGPWSTNASGATTVAPRAATPARDASLRTVATTSQPGGDGQLDRGGADPTGGAVDADPLAQAELALREQGVVGGGVVLGEAAGLGPADALGHREGDDLGHDGQLGLAGAGDDRHHPVARAEPPAAGADGHDLAGQLEAGQVGRRRAGRRRVQPLGLHQVAAAHAGGPHPHQQVAGAGLGVGLLAPGDGAVDDRDRVHGVVAARCVAGAASAPLVHRHVVALAGARRRAGGAGRSSGPARAARPSGRASPTPGGWRTAPVNISVGKPIAW